MWSRKVGSKVFSFIVLMVLIDSEVDFILLSFVLRIFFWIFELQNARM